MTSIYKTAYPYYRDKHKMSITELAERYKLTREELSMSKDKTQDINFQLCHAVLLIVFKNFNYFPKLSYIPKEIVNHVKDQLQIPNADFSEVV